MMPKRCVMNPAVNCSDFSIIIKNPVINVFFKIIFYSVTCCCHLETI